MFNKFKGSFQMFAFLCIWRFIVFFHQVFPKTSGVFAGEVAPITLERFLRWVVRLGHLDKSVSQSVRRQQFHILTQQRRAFNIQKLRSQTTKIDPEYIRSSESTKINLQAIGWLLWYFSITHSTADIRITSPFAGQEQRRCCENKPPFHHLGGRCLSKKKMLQKTNITQSQKQLLFSC